jgi:hypothetical protein
MVTGRSYTAWGPQVQGAHEPTAKNYRFTLTEHRAQFGRIRAYSRELSLVGIRLSVANHSVIIVPSIAAEREI